MIFLFHFFLHTSSSFLTDFVNNSQIIVNYLFFLSFLEVLTCNLFLLKLSFYSAFISDDHFCQFIVCLAIFSIKISTNRLVKQARGKLVDHELILSFLPFVELGVLVVTFEVHDERSCIDLVHSHMSCTTSNRIHVLSILICIYVSKSLSLS